MSPRRFPCTGCGTELRVSEPTTTIACCPDCESVQPVPAEGCAVCVSSPRARQMTRGQSCMLCALPQHAHNLAHPHKLDAGRTCPGFVPQSSYQALAGVAS